MRLKNNQTGFGIISLLITVTIIALLGWWSLSRLTNNKDPEEAKTEAIEKATDAVDKANDAKNKADNLIDDANEVNQSLENLR